METLARTAARAEHESICEAVVLAVADAEGVEPENLRPNLYDVIDPDGLEQLFADGEQAILSDLSVTFAYGDWSVHVHGDGQVSVIDRDSVGLREIGDR